ncbi:benzoate/H(+) symporter BenE family transporter [Frankia sp. QA3]|uniref:benzoate/H(+) symporter BenE family transporter n=1 Tax=Frankia sp. QA3 TaxID=710111 RepID=UPI000269BD6B|nr:benzoate/H(+) symporter BenE family transporter [Frankia sp. QA3]EIV93023.1 benzoate transporter [Frankia sp. QA3]
MSAETLVAPRTDARSSLRRDVSVSAIVAGLVAVVVSYSGPFVVVLAAARAAGLSAGHTTSWVWAISLGSGLSCFVLSWWTRTPVITAWSTPGAALLLTSLGGYRYSDAIGAFLIAAIGMTVVGLSGLFGRLITLVPSTIINAMLAGILLPFVLGAYAQVPNATAIALTMLVVFTVGKRLLPRYAVLATLLAGVGVASAQGQLDLGQVRFALATPELTMPTLSPAALIGIGLPLFIVTMASQNAPGIGILTASGYEPEDRKLLGGTGIVSVVLAPFGCHAINLAAITAAICTGSEAHADPRRRYIAGMSAGVCYVIVGLFGTGLVQLFAAMPKALVAVLAGTALLAALLGGLVAAVQETATRDAALVTLAVTASGLTVARIGSAFWGLVAGVATHLILTVGSRDTRGR